jgi:NitT/TauT family transport system substrate-binding protein
MNLMTRRFALTGLGLTAVLRRAQGAATQVRVGYVPVIGASALFVLDGAGWAKAAGLDLSMTRFDSGPAAIQALASGTLDLLAIGVAPVAVAYSKRLPVRIVSAAGLGGSYFMAGPALAEALSSAPSRAAAFAALRSRLGRPVKLATLPPGAVPTVALNYWLFKTGGVAASDVEIVPLGIDGVQQAILTHSVDGGAILEPSATLVEVRDPAIKAIVTASQMFPNIPGVVIAATQSFQTRSPASLETLVRLAIRATSLIRNQPAQAAPYVAATLGGGLIDPSIMLKALKSPAISFETDPRSIVEPTRAMLAYEAQLGDFVTAPEIAGLFDPSVWLRASSARASGGR